MTTRNPRLFNPRRMWLAATVVGVCAGVLLGGASGGRTASSRQEAAAPQAATAGPGAMVRIRALGTRSGGPTGELKGIRDEELTIGRTLVVQFGTTDAFSTGPCAPRAVFQPVLPGAGLLWRVEATLLEASPEGTSLRVHWTRTVRNASGSQVQKDETTDIRLGRTDYRILDYEDLSAGPASPCASVLVQIAAEPRVMVAQAATATVDVWTVEETAGRAARSVHERIGGAIGEPLPFQMFSLDYPVTAGDGAAGAAPPAVELGVSGTLLLMPASDGTFQATVTVWRKFSYGDNWARGEGRQQFAASVGRTVALVLPDPGGSLVGPVPLAGPLVEGVSRRDGLLRIDLPRLLAGRQISLYVKIVGIR
jgi:hypothetical protein